MHAEVNPCWDMKMKSSSSKQMSTLDMHARMRQKQEETVVCMGIIIITGKYPKLQNNIELKKFEVAKLFVIRESRKKLFWHHKKFLLCISSNT